MIRVIKQIWVKPAESGPEDWEQLPLVPATATLKVKTTQEKAGLLKTYNLSATLRREVPILSKNLRVRIRYDEGHETFGTQDLPVRFETERENRLTISAKYKAQGNP